MVVNPSPICCETRPLRGTRPVLMSLKSQQVTQQQEPSLLAAHRAGPVAHAAAWIRRGCHGNRVKRKQDVEGLAVKAKEDMARLWCTDTEKIT